VCPVNITCGSSSRPIETRKIGMKTAAPKNSDPLHRRPLVRDEAVERDAGEERADDPLDPEDLGERGHEEQRDDDHDVAGDAVRAPAAEGGVDRTGERGERLPRSRQ